MTLSINLVSSRVQQQFIAVVNELHGDRVVVVVNHCFTSLCGTNGLLSDIVIR